MGGEGSRSRLALAEHPSPVARQRASHLLALFSRGEVRGRVGDAVKGLLDTGDPRATTEVLRGLWGTSVSPEVERRLIELAKDPATRHDAIYFALSTLRDRSAAVIDVLVEALGEVDSNVSQRALWGLGHGVPGEHHARAADAMLALFLSRSDRRIRDRSLDLVGRYGGETHAAALEEVARDASVLEDGARAAAETARRIRARGRADRGGPPARARGSRRTRPDGAPPGPEIRVASVGGRGR